MCKTLFLHNSITTRHISILPTSKKSHTQSFPRVLSLSLSLSILGFFFFFPLYGELSKIKTGEREGAKKPNLERKRKRERTPGKFTGFVEREKERKKPI